MQASINKYHSIVIGAGLAGLTTACLLAQAGKKTLLLATGLGAVSLASACVDVLGYQPTQSKKPLTAPLDGLSDFLRDWPEHPYHILGEAMIKAGLESFLEVLASQNLAYQGDINHNWWLPSTGGAIHPTVLAPTSMIAGDLRKPDTMLIVGFTELRDFYPALISDNINAQNLGVTSGAITIEAPPPIQANMDSTPFDLASAFEDADFRQAIVEQVKKASQDYERIAFPAVLGLKAHQTVINDLKQQLDKPIFEISTLPPSIPGRRLVEALKDAFLQAGGRLIIGSKVLDGHIEAGKVTHIRYQTVTRPKAVYAKNYILATGGIFGGGLESNHQGKVWESIFNLPVAADTIRQAWFKSEFMDPTGHAINRYGIRVNAHLNPIATTNHPIATNLYIVGSLLAGTNWVHGRTGDGVALASAASVAQILG